MMFKILAIIVTFLFAGSGYAQECLEPTDEFISELRTFLPDESELGAISAVRDGSRRKMYYVAVELEVDGHQDIALFATTTIEGFGLMQAANDMAASNSTMFDGRETQMDASESDDAARQAQNCL